MVKADAVWMEEFCGLESIRVMMSVLVYWIQLFDSKEFKQRFLIQKLLILYQIGCKIDTG